MIYVEAMPCIAGLRNMTDTCSAACVDVAQEAPEWEPPEIGAPTGLPAFLKGFPVNAPIVRFPNCAAGWVSVLGRWMAVAAIIGGLFAGLHFASGLMARPVFCLVQVEGVSMLPTLLPGQEVAFARAPWRVGSVVLADVGEDEPVIKRVALAEGRNVWLWGDNIRVTQIYATTSDKILAVMAWRMPIIFPSRDCEILPDGRYAALSNE